MGFLFFIVTILILPLQSVAATYYSSPSGSGTTCSSGLPCSLASGIDKLVGGDTLILNNGTYTGNEMSEWNGGTLHLPPDGSAGALTTIRAANVGQAILDGQYNAPVISNINVDSRARQYIKFDGLHFRRGSCGVVSFMGKYSQFTNCGFEDGSNGPDECAIAAIASSLNYQSNYNLVEDSWIWGRGRYGIYFSGGPSLGPGSHYNIFRRVVVRLDAVPSGWVSASFRFYHGSDNTCENCFAIDSRYDGALESSAFTMGGGSSDSERNHVWDSSIALNNTSSNTSVPGYFVEDLDTLNTWRNSVIWGGNYHGIASTSGSGTGTINFSYMTIGANAGTQVSNNAAPTWNLSNSLVNVPANRTGFSGVSSITNTDYYLNSGASAGQTATPITLAVLNAGLKYLPRIEVGSTLASNGVGANILYQQGTSGTYYGQTGWNTTSSTQLWPLANETLWATKLKNYTTYGPGGNRGFAALAGVKTNPLTSYIWNYLGASPLLETASDIYGTPPPPSTGDIKAYVSGTFKAAPVKAYIGGAWKTAPLKVYESGSWKVTPY